ncbi:VOC family protein [Virgibacillus oceani]
MVGVEINMIVTDSLRALELYEKIFEIERVEVTDFPKGENEVIFSLYGVRFHMLDENPQFGLKAPDEEDPKSISFNVMVTDIKETFSKAISLGSIEMQAVTDLSDYGVSNAIFIDPFGYQWILHQVHEKVNFEERVELWEQKREN